jgi:hypothetical protein
MERKDLQERFAKHTKYLEKTYPWYGRGSTTRRSDVANIPMFFPTNIASVS